jgi:hypothetical protein
MKVQKLLCILLLVFSIFSLSCASQIILNDRQPTPEPTTESTPPIPVDDFEERLRSVQTGNFDFVYAFKRMDGQAFTSEDKKYLRENIPIDANQKQLTSDEKAVIVGSNYLFTPENLDALKKRFKIEDYSPEKEEPKPEQNSNANPKRVQNSNVNR